MKRYEIERAVLAADLPGPAAGIMLSLCTRIYRDQGVIPAAAQPSLTRLAADTGYSRSTIVRHLAALEKDGWLIRVRPPVWLARQLHVTTAYVPRIPAGYPQARVTGALGVGALRGEARITAERALAAHEDEARRAAGSELGAPHDAARRTPGRNTDTPESRDTDPPPCDHGVPGGSEPSPRTGKPICPLCRMEV